MRRNLKSAGFSLVEVLVMTGVSAFLTIILAGMFTFISSGMESAKLSAEMSAFADSLKTAVFTKESCTANLAGSIVHSNVTDPGTLAKRRLVRFDNKGAEISEVVDLDHLDNTVPIQNIKLVSEANLGGNRMLANLIVSAEKKGLLGSSRLERKIPLLVDYDSANSVIRCSMASESELTVVAASVVATPAPAGTPAPGAPQTLKEVCRLASGGTMEIDPVTGYCVEPKVEVFRGSPQEAACGPGFRLKESHDVDTCDYDYAGDYEEEFGNKLQYENGESGAAEPVARRADRTNQKCICTIAKDIKDRSKFTCVANCVKK